MKNTGIIFALLTLIFFGASIFGQSETNQSSSLLDKDLRKYDLDFNEGQPDVLLMRIFSAAKIPGGMALADNVNAAKTYNFRTENFTLKSVLDSLVKLNEDYSWKEENGVINFLPKHEYPVLNTVIAEFKMHNSTKGEMLKALIGTKEFQNALQTNQLFKPRILITGGLTTRADKRKRFSIDCKNMTVGQILNEIVRVEGRAAWFYKEYASSFGNADKTEKRYYRLYFFVGHDWLDETD